MATENTFNFSITELDDDKGFYVEFENRIFKGDTPIMKKKAVYKENKYELIKWLSNIPNYFYKPHKLGGTNEK
jgi:hypothetical protein